MLYHEQTTDMFQTHHFAHEAVVAEVRQVHVQNAEGIATNTVFFLRIQDTQALNYRRPGFEIAAQQHGLAARDQDQTAVKRIAETVWSIWVSLVSMLPLGLYKVSHLCSIVPQTCVPTHNILPRIYFWIEKRPVHLIKNKSRIFQLSFQAFLFVHLFLESST